MICIDNKLISRDIFEVYFLCHYKKCLGACCIEGESGAPLAPDESDTIKRLLPIVWPLLREEAQAVIEKQGISYIDEQHDEVTSLVNGKHCVFATIGEDGGCLCAFEKLYREGKTDFVKPLSCHLYPIRVKHFTSGMMALNYDEWDICKMAKVLGKRKGVLLYEALEEPLVRAFGKDFYTQLTECAKLLKQE